LDLIHFIPRLLHLLSLIVCVNGSISRNIFLRCLSLSWREYMGEYAGGVFLEWHH
jgi:hypothetical protein